MQRINGTRIILGGLAAGVVINLGEALVNGLLLADQWANGMKALGRSPNLGILSNVMFNLWGFLIGIFAIWLYVGLRPRFGAGPRTAIIAAVATWIPGSLLASMAPIALHLFARRLFAFDVAATLVEMVVGTLIGGWLYKDRAEPAAITQTAGA